MIVSSLPRIGIEFSSEYLAMVVLDQGPNETVAKECRERSIAEGMLCPNFLSRNIQDVKGLKSNLETLCGEATKSHERLGLVLPDSVVKVSLVSLDSVPKSSKDLDVLLKWKIANSIPFDIDEAQVSYSLQGDNENGNSQFIVLTSRRDIILEYENLCASIGLKAGLILPSSIAVSKFLHASVLKTRSGDWLFVNAFNQSGSIVIFRDKKIIYFRNLSSGSTEELGALVHQASMYYEDRLKGKGFEGILYLDKERDAQASELRRSVLMPMVDSSDVIDLEKTEVLRMIPATEKTLCAASVGMLSKIEI